MKFFHIAVLVAFFLPLSGCDGQTSEGKIHESAALNKSSSKQSPNWDDLSDTLPPERLAKLHKEAEAGDAFAQQELGFYYDTQKDEVKAFEWTQKAAAQGWAVAQRRLAHMYALKDDVKAVEWYQKAAAQADADAQYKLGLMYDNGLYITKDSVKAAEWYQKAAVQGLAAAQSNLGTKFYYGDGVPKDSVKAVEWFQKAAVQGDADAQSKLGFMYTRGDGVPKDSVKAFEWTQKAAAQGLSYAQSTLGLMFYLGDGVKENLVRAYAWCNLAAAQGDVTAQSNRDSIEIHLTAAERNEAQQLASNWKKGDALLPANNDSSGNNTATEKTDKYSALDNPDFGRAPSKKKPIMQQTGTAFVVSSNGHAVTNYHVINGCTEVKVAGLEGVAKVITSDSVNDLALLQLPGINNNFAKFNPEPGKLRQGEDVIV
ncbi:MAG: tetratricopeptide repeat-containing serine protease family protein, partial [Methylococcales bacterium]